jgi:hypothetical protein
MWDFVQIGKVGAAYDIDVRVLPVEVYLCLALIIIVVRCGVMATDESVILARTLFAVSVSCRLIAQTRPVLSLCIRLLLQ